MSLSATRYVWTIIVLGFAALAFGLRDWHPGNLVPFVGYLCLAIPAACMKVSLPGVTGTMSVLYIFILGSIVKFGLHETLVLGAVSVIVQCIWHPKLRPQPIQVLFSVSATAIATVLSYLCYHLVTGLSSPARIGATATIFFFGNTLLIAAAIALTENKQLREVWQTYYIWYLPFYLVGAAIVSGLDHAGGGFNWETATLVLAIAYVVYRTSKLYSDLLKAEQQRADEARKHALDLELAHTEAIEAATREHRAAQLQSDFVAAVSHEFRSPLTTICTLTELLVDNRIRDDVGRKDTYNFIERETARLQTLVEELLNFASIESGEKHYALRIIDAAALVGKVVEDFRKEVIAASFTFETELTSRPAPVRADDEELRRVIRNLLENAVKYSPNWFTIWVSCEVLPTEVLISVRDRGMGISPEEQSEIFKKFVRGSAAKRAGIKGTGIGLSLVRQIVQAFGGDVSVVSSTEVGSTFTIVLPLRGE